QGVLVVHVDPDVLRRSLDRLAPPPATAAHVVDEDVEGRPRPGDRGHDFLDVRGNRDVRLDSERADSLLLHLCRRARDPFPLPRAYRDVATLLGESFRDRQPYAVA